MDPTVEKKYNRLFVILSGIFITNALLAEIIGGKIFSVESTLGTSPAAIPLLGYEMSFNLTAGVLIWPIVFLTTDLINEYFGKPGVKRISYFTAILIAYAFVVLFASMKLAPADFWLMRTTDDGSVLNMHSAFNAVFGQGLRIIIGSLVAFLVGQLVDVFVFQRLRRLTGSRMVWLRATGSTVVSQFVDSFVVLFIAFYGTFSTQQIVAIGITNYIYKFVIAIALTPLIYLGHSLIDSYLGKSHAERLSAEATERSGGFF